MQTLRRTAALQIQLLELVVLQKDVGELIERVAAILDMPIVLFDTRGRVVASSRTAAGSPDLAPRLWRAYEAGRGAPDPAWSVSDAGERVLFRDVLVMGQAERVLVAATTRSRPTEFAGASLLFLQQLVTLDLLRGKDELRMRRRLRRGLLRDVLAGDEAPDQLRIRLQAQGFDDESVLRIAVVEPAAPHPHAAETRSGRAAGDQPARRHRHRAQRAPPPLSDVLQGCARGGAHRVPRRRHGHRARLARGAARGRRARRPRGRGRRLLVAARRDRRRRPRPAAGQGRVHLGPPRPEPGGSGIFEELSGHFRLLDALDEEELDGIVQRTFGALLEYDARHRASLYKTLRTLFEHRLAVQETADALHIHRNTLQKRLANAEQLLGIDLSDLDAIVDVRLGLHAAELLGEPLD